MYERRNLCLIQNTPHINDSNQKRMRCVVLFVCQVHFINIRNLDRWDIKFEKKHDHQSKKNYR